MSRMHLLLRRHSMWAVLLAVIVPLGVLLALQYRSLVRLESLSTIAHQATLDNYLEAVGNEVSYVYESGAERALNLSTEVFTESCWDTASYHFKKKDVRGARMFFVVSFLEGEWGRMVFFGPRGDRVAIDPYGPEYRAIFLAATPWSVLGKKGIPVGPTSLAIDERDPDNRVIVNPITQTIDEDTARVLGVAGMIVDGDYFERTLLPQTIERALPTFFGKEGAARPAVTVRNGAGELVYVDGHLPGGRGSTIEEDTSRALPFVFTDWKIGLHAGGMTPEKVARANFNLNLTFSVLLGLVLLAGVLLALRTAARAVRLSEMKTDFVSNVSHELRTPLASIRAFGELLALGRVEEDRTQEYGQRIERESRRLTALIHNILDFSHLESGRKAYDFEPVDAAEVLDSVLDSFASRFERNGFELEVVRPQRAVPVQADVDALAQVLTNLLDNAIKYSTDRKAVTVTLERREHTGPGWATIAVRDRGIGIRRQEQKRIFERFHRVANSLVHDIKGSGLGLSLVEQIARAHGGKVTVESEVGRGSTFTVWLPLDPQRLTRAEPAAHAPRTVPEAGT